MKLTIGQIVAVAFSLVFAVVLIYYPPFEAATVASSTSSQVVYAPIVTPPVIGAANGRLDVSLLLIELAFVAFIGVAIFLAASQARKDH